MIYTPAEVASARELVAEYNAAYERGEEPHFPQEAWNIVKQAERNEWRKAA